LRLSQSLPKLGAQQSIHTLPRTSIFSSTPSSPSNLIQQFPCKVITRGIRDIIPTIDPGFFLEKNLHFSISKLRTNLKIHW